MTASIKENYMVSAGIQEGDMCAASTDRLGQIFTVGVPHTITTVYLKGFRNIGGTPGTITVAIHAVNELGFPTGSALASGTYNASSLPEGAQMWPNFPNAAWFSATMGVAYTCAENTQYAIVVNGPTTDASNIFFWVMDGGGIYSGGYRVNSIDSGTTYTGKVGDVVSVYDELFQIWGDWINQLTIAHIKERLLIASAVSTYDTDLTSALDEAKRYVVNELLKYDESFEGNFILEDTALGDITYDIGAGLFKRRHMPQDMNEQPGWLAMGRQKLKDYIAAVYTGSVLFVGTD